MTDELILDNWDRLSARQCQAVAKRLARELPDGFAFRAVERHKLGAQQHRVAMFTFGDAAFALIPGAEVRLGYDADRPWEPTPDEAESWLGSVEEYGIPYSAQEYIARVTRRPRTVFLKPFLVENEAGALREGGGIRFERQVSCTHAEVAALMAREGFRLPTCDEWEYACGAGATTLFRWGDHVPCDRYPTDDVSHVRATWQYLGRSSDKLDSSGGGFTLDWDLHRRPNAFGIFIASDPYEKELVAEPGITRGGDGGSIICGGAGFFEGWLILATAYFEDRTCRFNPDKLIESDSIMGRRVLPLG